MGGAMIDKKRVKLHGELAAYHAALARDATLDIVHNYHQDLSYRLATEARTIAERARIANVARQQAEKLSHRDQVLPGVA
jgi:hypothetical protein